MGRIFVCGEAIMDFVPRKLGAQDVFLPLPGGSPFNIAKAAALAGADAHFLGALSRDLFGQRLFADLQAHGVKTALTPRSDDPTSLAFVDMSQGRPAYAFYDRDSAAVNMAPSAAGITAQPGDMLCVGSISLIPAQGAERIARFALEQSAQMMLAIDPNVRASMIEDRASWTARLKRLFAAASIIKISDEDLSFLSPGLSPEGFAVERLAAGTALVVVTGGADGAEGFTSAGWARATAPEVEVVDTVGAGDAFMGNLLAGLQARGLRDAGAIAGLEGDGLEELLAQAAWAGALTCTREGCQPPRREETETAMAHAATPLQSAAP